MSRGLRTGKIMLSLIWTRTSNEQYFTLLFLQVVLLLIVNCKKPPRTPETRNNFLARLSLIIIMNDLLCCCSLLLLIAVRTPNKEYNFLPFLYFTQVISTCNHNHSSHSTSTSHNPQSLTTIVQPKLQHSAYPKSYLHNFKILFNIGHLNFSLSLGYCYSRWLKYIVQKAEPSTVPRQQCMPKCYLWRLHNIELNLYDTCDLAVK